ncbi:hypothetical protein HPB52_007221 [Rhipicephalus sanguineus]|uniref:Peptidase M13 C-terminal domain-containing protein n=1 Tax=Rhipicephalus sanguineus TaxID=34632 RepID=A0A9D4PT68_RHISA|nr:hypothetical protein HPB52_007221 [Rhipicephalus sanguineus]
MDTKHQEEHPAGKDPTGQCLGGRPDAATPAASSEASSRGSRETTESSTNTSDAESRGRSDGHTDETSETDSSETTSSYDSHGPPHDFGEPRVVAVDVDDDVEAAPRCEPFGSAAVAALALVAAFVITVVFMTLRALYGYDVEMTANDIDEEPTLSFFRLPEGEPAIMALGNHYEPERSLQIQDEALNTLKTLLDSSSLPESGHTAMQKAVSLFRACVRFAKDGLALELPKIRHFLESVGLNLTGRQGQVAKDTTDNPVLPMLRLSLQYALHIFVAVRIDGLHVVNGKKIMRVVVSRTDQDWLRERSMLSEQEKKDYYAGVLLVYEAKPLRPEIVMLIPDIAHFESEAALELLKLITQPESWPKGHQLICWSLIRQMIGFGRSPLLATLPESDLASHCIRKVSEVMEPAIQGLLLFKQFTPEARAQLEAIASVVLETITKHLKERGNTSRHWVDSARLEALHRLATVELAIGFPGNIRVESDLEAMYGSFPKAKRIFWEAWIPSAKMVQKRILERVGQPDVNFGAAGMRAAYSPCLNKLVIPAGIARPPFLISNGPPSYNYAAIGMLDEDYAYIPNLNIDAELLHVLAATSSSYEAFRTLPASQINRVLPTLNYTAEQLFFVVNCALRCCDDDTYRADDDNLFCEDGVSSCSSPSGCNSVVKRMPEFAAAFHCPAGSKMNPRDTCAM